MEGYIVYRGKKASNANSTKLSIPTLDVLSLIPPISNTNKNVMARQLVYAKYDFTTDLSALKAVSPRLSRI